MNAAGKLVAAEEVSPLARRLAGRRLVLAFGHFNVIHPGHLRFLAHARALGDALVCAVWHDDELRRRAPAAAWFGQDERAHALACQADVDHVVALADGGLAAAVAALAPAVLVLGKEYETEQAAAVAAVVAQVRSLGGRIVYHAGRTSYAEDALPARPADAVALDRRAAFLQACARQRVDAASLLGRCADFAPRRLVVLGDAIVDQYVACDALGMSAEAPVIALKELRSREYVGGAGIVACHVRALGAEVDFVSVTGDDAPAAFTAGELAARGVRAHLLTDPARPTTFKIRYMVGNQKMLRVSRLEQTSVPLAVESALIERLEALIPACHGVIVSDFVYGVVTPRVLAAATALARRHGVPLFGDLQCSSQVGSVLKFQGFTLISPNEREARIALGDNDSGLEAVAQQLLARTGAASLLLTLGPQGFIAYDRVGQATASESFPALDPNPVDVTGAGDALLSAVAVAMSSGWSLMQAAALGSCVAALAVARLGNIPITAADIGAYRQRLAAARGAAG